MTATISMDASGRLVLPKAFRERLQLTAGTRLKLDLIADRIEITAELEPEAHLVHDGKRMVFSGGAGFQAGAAVLADRDERAERLQPRP